MFSWQDWTTGLTRWTTCLWTRTRASLTTWASTSCRTWRTWRRRTGSTSPPPRTTPGSSTSRATSSTTTSSRWTRSRRTSRNSSSNCRTWVLLMGLVESLEWFLLAFCSKILGDGRDLWIVLLSFYECRFSGRNTQTLSSVNEFTWTYCTHRWRQH